MTATLSNKTLKALSEGRAGGDGGDLTEYLKKNKDTATELTINNGVIDKTTQFKYEIEGEKGTITISKIVNDIKNLRDKEPTVEDTDGNKVDLSEYLKENGGFASDLTIESGSIYQETKLFYGEDDISYKTVADFINSVNDIPNQINQAVEQGVAKSKLYVNDQAKELVESFTGEINTTVDELKNGSKLYTDAEIVNAKKEVETKWFDKFNDLNSDVTKLNGKTSHLNDLGEIKENMVVKYNYEEKKKEEDGKTIYETKNDQKTISAIMQNILKLNKQTKNLDKDGILNDVTIRGAFFSDLYNKNYTFAQKVSFHKTLYFKQEQNNPESENKFITLFTSEDLYKLLQLYIKDNNTNDYIYNGVISPDTQLQYTIDKKITQDETTTTIKEIKSLTSNQIGNSIKAFVNKTKKLDSSGNALNIDLSWKISDKKIVNISNGKANKLILNNDCEILKKNGTTVNLEKIASYNTDGFVKKERDTANDLNLYWDGESKHIDNDSISGFHNIYFPSNGGEFFTDGPINFHWGNEIAFQIKSAKEINFWAPMTKDSFKFASLQQFFESAFDTNFSRKFHALTEKIQARQLNSPNISDAANLLKDSKKFTGGGSKAKPFNLLADETPVEEEEETSEQIMESFEKTMLDQFDYFYKTDEALLDYLMKFLIESLDYDYIDNNEIADISTNSLLADSMLNHIHEKAYMFEQLAGFGYKFSIFDLICNCELEDGKNILTLEINYSEKKNHLLVYIFNSKEDLNNFVFTEEGVKYIFEIIINTSDNTAELRSNISIINSTYEINTNLKHITFKIEANIEIKDYLELTNVYFKVPQNNYYIDYIKNLGSSSSSGNLDSSKYYTKVELDDKLTSYRKYNDTTFELNDYFPISNEGNSSRIDNIPSFRGISLVGTYIKNDETIKFDIKIENKQGTYRHGSYDYDYYLIEDNIYLRCRAHTKNYVEFI